MGRTLKLPGLVLAILAVGSAPAAAQMFNYTGSEQTYTVPAGVTVLDVSMSGGDGGGVSTVVQGAGGPGGHGGTASAVLAVNSDQTLYVEVGGAGGIGGKLSSPVGGWNGGASAGSITGEVAFGAGGGGGGASDVRTVPCGSQCPGSGASLGTRLLVAGGGGGGGVDDAGRVFAGADANPGSGPMPGSPPNGGTAGQSAPGGGGTGCSGTGMAGAGGSAGAGAAVALNAAVTMDGGGGGGGYEGGGGGGVCSSSSDDQGGAGGGGSDFASAQASDVAMGIDSTADANGSVSIIPAPPVLQIAPTITGTYTVGATLSVVHGQYVNVDQYAYQWYRCNASGNGCAQILGATGSAWTLASNDLGTTLRVDETASGAAGAAAPVLSGPTPVITAAAAPPQPSGTQQPATGSPQQSATVSPQLELGPVKLAGTRATVHLSCSGTTGGECRGSIAFRASRHGAARTTKSRISQGDKRASGEVTVAGTAFTLASGKSAALTVKLNATGRRLLDRFYRLPTDLTITGTTIRAERVTFSYPRVDAFVSWTWSYNGAHTNIQQLGVTGIPHDGQVTVACRGGGCRASEERFTPKRGNSVTLASSIIKAGVLTAGAKLQITISAPDSVAKVLTITTRRNNYPSVVKGCKLPGSTHPTTCA